MYQPSFPRDHFFIIPFQHSSCYDGNDGWFPLQKLTEEITYDVEESFRSWRKE